MDVVVYGIPTCGTVKKVRAWLDARGTGHRFVDLRTDPPGRERVAAWVRTFGFAAMRNTSGASYRALGLEKDTWGEERWIHAYDEDPMLVRRPVVEVGGRPATVGFGDGGAALTAALVAIAG